MGPGSSPGRHRICCEACEFYPVRSDDRDAVIVVDRPRGAEVGPIPIALAAVFWCAAKLVFGHARDVAAEPCIVFQRLPGQRVMIIAESQNAAKAEHRVGHAPALLVDHDALDRTDLAILGAIDRCALDLVAADQIANFTLTKLVLAKCHESLHSVSSRATADKEHRSCIVPAAFR